MDGGEESLGDGDPSDPVAVVWAMWAAKQAGRIDDVVATMDRDVTWIPGTRPARSYYYRHDGIRRMNADVERAIGPSELHIDSVTVLDDGRVVTRGRQTRHAESGATSTVAFEAFCTLRDGLIISVESNTVDNG